MNLLSPTRSWFVYAGTAFLAVIAALGGGRIHSALAAPAPHPTRLNLQLHKKVDGGWRLSWNPDAIAMRQASAADLTILDGNMPKRFHLDAAALQSRSMTYEPHSEIVLVEMRLGLASGQDPLDEVVYLVDAKQTPRTQASRSANGTPLENRQRGSIDWLKPVEVGPSVRRGSDLTSSRGYEDARPPEIRSNDPSVKLPSEIADLRLPNPERVLRSQAESRQPLAGNVEPPKLIVREDPIYPQEGGKLGGVVKLAFKINTEGRVNNIEVISGNPPFAAAAVAAVSTWRYKPLRRDGEPLETENSVTVRFQADESKSVWLSGYYF